MQRLRSASSVKLVYIGNQELVKRALTFNEACASVRDKTMSNLQVRQSVHNGSSPILAAITLPLIAATFFLLAFSARADNAPLMPSPDYEPEQVVKIVIDSLQGNTEPEDQGIATVFRFASPGNQANTGPFDRFARMIRGGFSDMLNHAGARYDPMEVSGDTAVQAVWLLTDSGKEVGYAFQLSRQSSGKFKDIWMTDTVVPLGKGSRSGTEI